MRNVPFAPFEGIGCRYSRAHRRPHLYARPPVGAPQGLASIDVPALGGAANTVPLGGRGDGTLCGEAVKADLWQCNVTEKWGAGACGGSTTCIGATGALKMLSKKWHFAPSPPAQEHTDKRRVMEALAPHLRTPCTCFSVAAVPKGVGYTGGFPVTKKYTFHARCSHIRGLQVRALMLCSR